VPQTYEPVDGEALQMNRQAEKPSERMVPDPPIECVVGIRTLSGRLVKAFDVRIIAEDIYVNYSDCSTPEAHSSYHASGQRHTKVGGQFIEWTGGPTGDMEPMKLYRTPPGLVAGRSGCWTVGWETRKLDAILPNLSSRADMLVDAPPLDGTESILAFEVCVVGNEAKRRNNIVGFRIIKSHRFGNTVQVEIDAFVVDESGI
jgi:hypothetical protein